MGGSMGMCGGEVTAAGADGCGKDAGPALKPGVEVAEVWGSVS